MPPHETDPGRPPKKGGFTLIELTVVIGIIAVLAASLIPVITAPLLQERRYEVTREMGAIEEAIRGRPELGDFGFIGSIGTVPSNVTQLLAQGSFAAASVSTAGVPRGWQGPYLRVSTPFPDKDPWGQPYQILSQTTGAYQLQWMIRSTGPDATAGTADDVYYPYDSATWWNAYALSLAVDVMIQTGPSIKPVPNGTPITLRVSNGSGGETSPASAPTTTDGRVTFSTGSSFKIPLGMHSISFTYNGVPYNRTIVVNQPASAATVYIPSTVGFAPASCAIGGSVGFSSTSVMQCSPVMGVSVVPGQVVSAEYNGMVRSGTAGKRCYVAVQLGYPTASGFGGPCLNGYLGASCATEDLNLNPAFGTATTASTALYSPVSTARVFQYTGASAGSFNAAVIVQPEAGNTCFFDPGGTLLVSTWAP